MTAVLLINLTFDSTPEEPRRRHELSTEPNPIFRFRPGCAGRSASLETEPVPPLHPGRRAHLSLPRWLQGVPLRGV